MIAAVNLPAATATVEGVLTNLGSADRSLTVNPPAGAGPLRVTVPVIATAEPPTTVD